MLSLPLDSPSFLLHAIGLVLTAGISVTAAGWVARQSSDETGRTMVALLLVHATMAALFLVELLVTSPLLKGVLARLWYGLILAVPVVWFTFAVYYAGLDYWLSKPVRVGLVLSAVVPFVLAVTEPLHGLLVADVALRTEPFLHRSGTPSRLGTVFFLLGSVYTLAGFHLLFRLSVFSRRSSRWQTVGLLAGIVVVYAPAVLSVTDYAPIRNFPYGIYGAGVFGVIVAVSLFRTRLFAVAPLARDALFDSLDDAIVVVDTDRRLVDFNDRALATFPELDGSIGTTLDAVCPALVGSSDEPVGLEQSETAVDDASGTRFPETVQRTVDGVARSFNVATSEISRGGKQRGYGLVVSDITELVTYSTKLERKTEQLEQFAGVLSHDLRNPVLVARGNVDLAREQHDSDHLQKTTAALDRIEGMIDDLLVLARNGETVADPTVVSLLAVVDDAWETSDTRGATRTVTFERECRLSADRSRLRTLLENLFRNAVDHGGSHVTVGLIPTGFYVADDGPGIPEDERDDVFEYGYTTADDGTGFGLAIVRSVADAHDWSLAVTESESGGARFEISGVHTRESDGPGADRSSPTAPATDQ